MNYVLVPDNQPRVTIHFFNYPDESDLDGGAFPNGTVSDSVEHAGRNAGRARRARSRSQQWQQDVNNTGGDRHSIIVQPGAGFIWETWLTKLVASGWEASNGAKFNLKSNALRPAGWTSGDAAGLPMFPALVRYDECERGMVEHALRLVVKRTRRRSIYPATHYASVATATSPEHPGDGPAPATEVELRHPGNLDEAGEGRAARAEEIRRDRRGQRRLLFDLRLPGRPLPCGLFRSSFNYRDQQFRGGANDRPDTGTALARRAERECGDYASDSIRRCRDAARKHHDDGPSAGRAVEDGFRSGNGHLWQCLASCDNSDVQPAGKLPADVARG